MSEVLVVNLPQLEQERAAHELVAKELEEIQVEYEKLKESKCVT